MSPSGTRAQRAMDLGFAMLLWFSWIVAVRSGPFWGQLAEMADALPPSYDGILRRIPFSLNATVLAVLAGAGIAAGLQMRVPLRALSFLTAAVLAFSTYPLALISWHRLWTAHGPAMDTALSFGEIAAFGAPIAVLLAWAAAADTWDMARGLAAQGVPRERSRRVVAGAAVMVAAGLAAAAVAAWAFSLAIGPAGAAQALDAGSPRTRLLLAVGAAAFLTVGALATARVGRTG